ncbi:hypothetical protein MMC08_007831 [Hypocenomyce scalaris]|nr:hypothetical protein [Hypocenomyce scalaris]
MPTPSPLAIATSSVLRLVKEEASYHKELQQQESRIQKIQSQDESAADENAWFQLKQERRAVEETKAVFPNLKERIKEAVGKVEERLETVKEDGKEGNVEEITKAKEAVAKAKASWREIA